MFGPNRKCKLYSRVIFIPLPSALFWRKNIHFGFEKKNRGNSRTQRNAKCSVVFDLFGKLLRSWSRKNPGIYFMLLTNAIIEF